MRLQVYPVEIIIDTALGQPVKYRLLSDINISGYTVPAGFITDGASVPRMFWSLLPPVDAYFPAAAVHDYLLSFDRDQRDFADRAFLECLQSLGISINKQALLYYSVRLYSSYRSVRRYLVSRDR